MSVIVKGMDMPLQCQRCPLSDDESRYCKAANKYIPMLGHPKFCPLVEVPTPHGDLIDRDALRDNNCDAFEIKGADGTILAMDVSIIDDAPIIIPAEEGET